MTDLGSFCEILIFSQINCLDNQTFREFIDENDWEREDFEYPRTMGNLTPEFKQKHQINFVVGFQIETLCLQITTLNEMATILSAANENVCILFGACDLKGGYAKSQTDTLDLFQKCFNAFNTKNSEANYTGESIEAQTKVKSKYHLLGFSIEADYDSQKIKATVECCKFSKNFRTHFMIDYKDWCDKNVVAKEWHFKPVKKTVKRLK